MARSYGNNTEATAAAREALEKQQAQEKAMGNKIESIVTIAALAIAGLSIVVCGVRCVSAVAAKNDYKEQAIEAQATYEELSAKLQDPAAQNFAYTDPTVGNMTETGKAIALMQNQIIAGQQSLNNVNYQSDMSGTPGSSTATFEDTETPEDVHASTTSETGGAVTLDPTDMAPSGSTEPSSETVDDTEATIAVDDYTTNSSSGMEYTPISDFFNTPTDSTGTTSNDTTVSQDSVTDTNVYGTTATRPQAELIKEFQTKYFSKPITNVDMVDANSTAWSWYGTWEFSGTYDFSVNEVPAMNAVWTCYEPSDTNHKRPLAFVTATYSQSQKRFTNAEATYTQYYVKYSEAQKDTFGSTSAGNNGDIGSTQGVLDSTTSNGMNGQGSENEYHVDLVDNGDNDDDTGVSTNSGNNNSSTNGASTNNAPTSTNNAPTSTNNAPTGTDPSLNPNGTATWVSGGGATGGNSSSGTSSGEWVPNNGSTGNSNSNSGSSTTNTGSNGTWVPSN